MNEVLETVKIRSPGFVQGHDLAIDNSVGGEITECFRDLRKSFVEVLEVPRIQDGFAARSDPNCAVAIQLNFISPAKAFGEF